MLPHKYFSPHISCLSAHPWRTKPQRSDAGCHSNIFQEKPSRNRKRKQNRKISCFFFTRFETPKHPTQIHAASLPRNYTVTALAQNRCFCKLWDSSKNASDFKHSQRPKIDGKSQEDEHNVFSLRHTIFEILCLRNSRISCWDRSELKITFVVKHQGGCFITSTSKTSIWLFTRLSQTTHWYW